MATRDSTERLRPSAERETDREAPAAAPAEAVLRLQRGAGNAAVARYMGARLARLSGNPQDVAPVPGATAGSFSETGTVHAAPTIEDAVNHTAPTQTAGGVSVAEFGVRVKATASSPIVAESVSEEDLFERTEAPTQSVAAGAPGADVVMINELFGSVAAPVVTEAADTSLFIDPGPTVDDVHQGLIGDCYDLATVIGIVNRDPNKIKSMMAPDGSGGATVTFYKRQETAPGAVGAFFGMGPTIEYKKENVVVDNTLAFRRTAASAGGSAPANERSIRTVANGLPYGHALFGARLRAAPAPKERKWWVDVVGNKLEVHRLDIFQMARWSPVLEKAFARFTEVYGQYGTSGKGPSGSAENQGPQGYANIAGGFPGYTLSLFYGQEGEYEAGGQGAADGTAWAPGLAGSTLLSRNSAAFDRLLEIAGSGGGRTRLVTARAYGGDAGDNVYFPRLTAAITALASDTDYTTNVSAQAQGDVTAVQAAVTAWTSATPDPSPMPTPPPANLRSTAKASLVAAARTASDSARNPTLFDAGRSKAVKDMIDLLLIVKNMPVDWSQGSRSVYSGHEYSVLSVDIRSIDGTPSAISSIPAALRPALYGRVDVNASRVHLMNPHHGNVPDPTGSGGAATGSGPNATGQFDVSLEQFFRLYAAVLSASFAPSS